MHIAVNTDYMGAFPAHVLKDSRSSHIFVHSDFLPGLLDYCRRHLPRFAVPRYVEFLEAPPKTLTGKVRKAQLRGQGVLTGTFDSLALSSGG